MLRFFYSNDSSSVTVENSYHTVLLWKAGKNVTVQLKCVLKHLRWRAKLKLNINH